MKTLLKNALLYTPNGTLTGCLAVEDKRISYVGTEKPAGSFDREMDMSGKLLLPDFSTATPIRL